MNATATKGIWEESLSNTIKMRFDTTRTPERITVQESGKNPTHFDFDEGINEANILKVRDTAKQAYNIK